METLIFLQCVNVDAAVHFNFRVLPAVLYYVIRCCNANQSVCITTGGWRNAYRWHATLQLTPLSSLYTPLETIHAERRVHGVAEMLHLQLQAWHQCVDARTSHDNIFLVTSYKWAQAIECIGTGKSHPEVKPFWNLRVRHYGRHHLGFCQRFSDDTRWLNRTLRV